MSSLGSDYDSEDLMNELDELREEDVKVIDTMEDLFKILGMQLIPLLYQIWIRLVRWT